MKVACTVTTYALGYNKSFLYTDTFVHVCAQSTPGFGFESSSNYEIIIIIISETEIEFDVLQIDQIF